MAQVVSKATGSRCAVAELLDLTYGQQECERGEIKISRSFECPRPRGGNVPLDEVGVTRRGK